MKLSILPSTIHDAELPRPQVGRKARSGFTLVEMMTALGCGSIILAAVITSGVALQRSFAAIEGYSVAEGNQMRVLDYIAMDSRRAYSASVTTDPNTNASTVTFLVADYYAKAAYASDPNHPGYNVGDPVPPTADANNSNGDTRIYYDGSDKGSASSAVWNSIQYYLSGTNFIRATGVVPSSTTFQGTWAATASYDVNDFVSYNNASYTCNTAITYDQIHPNSPPPTDTGHWSVWNPPAGSATAKAIATNVSAFTITPSDLSTNIICGITFQPTFASMPAANPVAGTTVYCNVFLRNPRARK